MTTKKDVKVETLGEWNQYANLSTEDALPKIYSHVKKISGDARDWYWKSIKSKRNSSLVIRFFSFILLVLGAALPITAGIYSDDVARLTLTQVGVTSLAVAGLLHAADKIFGWSSGWLRYMTTVTAMENVTRQFDLDWSQYMINKTAGWSDEDKRSLFDLAKKLEDDIFKLRSEETDKWVTEFNSSLALLGDLIKSQRESAEKAAETARAAVDAKEIAAAEKDKANTPGSIEISIVHKAMPIPVAIRLDDCAEEQVTSNSWAKRGVSPGHHTVHLSVGTPTPFSDSKIVIVPAGDIGRAEFKLP